MLAEQDKYIDKAYRRLEEMSADEQKRWEYEMRQKAIRDQRHMLASGRREGLREGLREGKREGEARINLLIQKLLADGRVEDLKKSSKNPDFQKKLLEEYNL